MNKEVELNVPLKERVYHLKSDWGFVDGISIRIRGRKVLRKYLRLMSMKLDGHSW